MPAGAGAADAPAAARTRRGGAVPAHRRQHVPRATCSWSARPPAPPTPTADADLVRDIAGELSLALASTRSLERLRASEERYRRVLESIPEGVLQIDAAGVTTFANQPGAALLGLPREQLVGLPLRGFLDDRGQRQLARWLAGPDASDAQPAPAPATGRVGEPAAAHGSAVADARVVRADGSTRSVRLVPDAAAGGPRPARQLAVHGHRHAPTTSTPAASSASSTTCAGWTAWASSSAASPTTSTTC